MWRDPKRLWRDPKSCEVAEKILNPEAILAENLPEGGL
jgi:hypothetical protein